MASGSGSDFLSRQREENGATQRISLEEPVAKRRLSSRGSSGSGELRKKSQRLLPQTSMGNGAVQEADLLRFPRVDAPAGEHQVERALDPDETGEPRRSPPGGKDSEVHFRKADLELRVIGAHPALAGEGDLRPSPEANAPDGGDDGKRKPLDSVHDGLARPHRLLRLLGGTDLLDFRDIRAGQEHPILRGSEDRAPEVRAGFELREDLVEPRHDRPG